MIIVISNPTPVEQEHRIINALFDEGLSIFHLRKLDYTSKELHHLIIKINREHHSKIAFHQHHELAEQVGSKRLHFTEQERKKNLHELEKFHKKDLTLSTSIHHVNAYASLPPVFEYCFLAPVFNSISKPDLQSMITPDFKLPARSGIKIIALGGISTNGIPDVKKYDFDGIAALGIIWQDPTKAVNNFKLLQQEWGN
jgi:thiamine-phosphate pyrophosphorylase